PSVDLPLVDCRGVTVRYGKGETEVVALANADLSVEAGERVALWGRSGSGKTTLLHVLGGLVTPNEGEVLWKGERLASLDVATRTRMRASRIAFVFQAANLLPTFTAFENVALAARSAVAPGEVAGAAEETLALVGLSAKLDALPGELSGGDAPRVLELIERLQARYGFTLIVATHDADTAARLSRRIELHDGHIATWTR